MKDIIQVLRANNVDRILVVSFTNHTVDKTLEMLLDTGEAGFVRLGGRSKNKRIADFSLEKLEEASKNPPEVGAKYRNMCIIKERLNSIMEKLQKSISEDDIVDWLHTEYPRQHQSLKDSPECITFSNRTQKPTSPSHSLLRQWIKGRDIQLNKIKLTHLRDETSEENINDNKMLNRSTSNEGDSLPSSNPAVPPKHQQKPARLLADLLVCEDVWMLATEERRVLFQSWKELAMAKLQDSLTADLKAAKEAFESARESWESVRDSVRRLSHLRSLMLNMPDQHRLHILRTRNIIGCTTAGAAKMIRLIKASNISKCSG